MVVRVNEISERSICVYSCRFLCTRRRTATRLGLGQTDGRIAVSVRLSQTLARSCPRLWARWLPAA